MLQFWNRFITSSFETKIGVATVLSIWLLAILGVTMALFLVWERPSEAQPSTPELTNVAINLTPITGPEGNSVAVQGQGWTADGLVLIYLTAATDNSLPSAAVTSLTADPSGQFIVIVPVPADPRWEQTGLVRVVAKAAEGPAITHALVSLAQPTVVAATATPEVTSEPVLTVTWPATATAEPTATPTQVVPVATPLPQPQTPLVTATTDLNVRGGPGLVYSLLGLLRAGQSAEVTGVSIDGQWWQIKFAGVPEGRGWLAARYVTAQNVSNVPVVQAPTPPASPTPVVITDWRGEYYSNPTLSGLPMLVRNDATLNFAWGSGSPAAEIGPDNFSARWSRTLFFPAGPYRFYLRADDGVRLWLDNQLIVEQWRDGGATTHTADVVLVDGAHHLKVEYYERGGEALLQLSWELLETYPDWKGEYFNNPNLSGAPVLVRNDLGINFGWGPNSPGPGVPADNFSARWTRTVYFAAGSYRFNVLVDDGTRLWIDDTKIIDQWRSGEPRTFSADVNLSEGNHRIRLEYFDYIYDAQVRLGWERLDHFPDWKAEYFDNRKLQGNPVIIRNETNIDHRWNHGSPGPGVPADNFSARWRRKADFQEGTYRFQVKVDDGVRLWVDDKQILDSWQDGQTRTFEVESRLSKGQHRIRIEYYERTGEARIEVSWKKVESPVNKPPQANPGGPYVVNEGSPITFDGRASYDPDGTVVHYEWDFDYGKGGFTVDAYGSTPSHSYADGPATFVVALRVTDEKGANHVATTQVIVQNVAPVVEAGGPYQGLVGNLITLSGAATDAGAKDQAGLTYLWDFGDGMSGAGPVVGHTYNQPNIYTAKLTVVDKDGGQSSDTAVVEVSKLNEPPVAKIVGPLTGTVGEKLIFDGSGSNDNDDKVVSYQWHFGDGTTANGISVEHSYDRAETFKVTLLVTDNQGLTSQADHLVQIEDIGGGNEAPLARITAPELAHAGQLVRFSGSGSSDPNGDLISYTWSFGDGSSGMGMEVEHSYVVTGTYQITLVVTDEAGLSGEATAFIHIGEVIHQAPVAGLAGSEAGQTGLSFNSSNSYRRTD